MHLCCTVHNKSCFIKAKSHPLSVYNHRSRLNRRGNTIPFRFGVILIYELVSATLVCGYEPGKHPQHRNIAPAHSQDRLSRTKQLAANYVCACIYVWIAVCRFVHLCTSPNLYGEPSLNGGFSWNEYFLTFTNRYTFTSKRPTVTAAAAAASSQ